MSLFFPDQTGGSACTHFTVTDDKTAGSGILPILPRCQLLSVYSPTRESSVNRDAGCSLTHDCHRGPLKPRNKHSSPLFGKSRLLSRHNQTALPPPPTSTPLDVRVSCWCSRHKMQLLTYYSGGGGREAGFSCIRPNCAKKSRRSVREAFNQAPLSCLNGNGSQPSRVVVRESRNFSESGSKARPGDSEQKSGARWGGNSPGAVRSGLLCGATCIPSRHLRLRRRSTCSMTDLRTVSRANSMFPAVTGSLELGLHPPSEAGGGHLAAPLAAPEAFLAILSENERGRICFSWCRQCDGMTIP